MINKGIKQYCYKCDKYVEYTVREVEQTVTVRGVDVIVTINEAVCSVCGTPVYDEKLSVENDKIIYDAYRKKVGLLTSSEIKAIRSKYSLTQTEFATILGLGEKSVTRYENGYIQNESNDILMRLSKNEYDFEQIFKMFETRNQTNESVQELLKKCNAYFDKQKKCGEIVRLSMNYTFNIPLKYKTEYASMGVY